MLKILIVDDDSMVYQVVKKTIPWEAHGMTVAAYAPNGLKAIEYLQENTADIVLVDLSMPHMGGLELIRQVYEYLPRTVFVVLSSHSEFRLVKESFCAGAFDYLLKVDIDDEEVTEKLLKRVTDKVHYLRKAGERSLDLGDLVSKLNTEQDKESYRYRIQILRPDPQANRLKLSRRLFGIAEQTSMVYGSYEGNLVILYYGESEEKIEKDSRLVNQVMLRQEGGILESGISDCGRYKDMEALYYEGMRNRDGGFVKIREYLMKNYSRPELSLKIAADELNMSQRTVSRYISESGGAMFKAYLNTIRIEAAKEMLKTTSMRIQEVAYAAGYMNVEHFTRIFKEKVGCSPSRYGAFRNPGDSEQKQQAGQE